MSLENELKQIDWDSLIAEWRAFDIEDPFRQLDPAPFVKSLILPPLPFVEAFLSAREDRDRDLVVRDLYAFFLDKRYYDRLNLLYFAFHIFDENSVLPTDVVDRTPFPHEDGIPSFRHSVR